jgi:two-component system cell cycle response regulator DivK
MTKILIVEDNEMNMRLFSDLVKTKGYQVFECLEGKKALDMARDIKPDLILMDIQMPEVDGLTATKLIRQEKEIAKTKIIAVTAFAMPGDLERILDGGLDGYISKPISVPNFLDTIDKALKEK